MEISRSSASNPTMRSAGSVSPGIAINWRPACPRVPRFLLGSATSPETMVSTIWRQLNRCTQAAEFERARIGRKIHGALAGRWWRVPIAAVIARLTYFAGCKDMRR